MQTAAKKIIEASNNPKKRNKKFFLTGKHNMGHSMKAVFPEYVNSLVKKEIKEIVSDDKGRPLPLPPPQQPASPQQKQEDERRKENEQEKGKGNEKEREKEEDEGEERIAGQYIEFDSAGPKASSPQYIAYEGESKKEKEKEEGNPQYIEYEVNRKSSFSGDEDDEDSSYGSDQEEDGKKEKANS